MRKPPHEAYLGGGGGAVQTPRQFSPRRGGQAGSLATQVVPLGQGAILKPQGLPVPLGGRAEEESCGRAVVRVVRARRMGTRSFILDGGVLLFVLRLLFGRLLVGVVDKVEVDMEWI